MRPFFIIRPESLGSALIVLTGFAVAVILFEGGMNLKFRRLKHAQRSIRQLILCGGLFTVAGGAAAAHYIMGWPWKSAILFGTLVMVTGPTVINPLLKRLKVKRKVKQEAREIALCCALKSDTASLTVKMLHHAGAEAVFGANVDIALWNRRLNSKQVYHQLWHLRQPPKEDADGPLLSRYGGSAMIAAAVRRNGRLLPVGDASVFKPGDEVQFPVFETERKMAGEFLQQEGWELIDTSEEAAFSTSMCSRPSTIPADRG